MENPFRPTAGAAPPDLVGRGGVLDEFAYGLHIGSGAPGLLTIFTGARGPLALYTASNEEAKHPTPLPRVRSKYLRVLNYRTQSALEVI